MQVYIPLLSFSQQRSDGSAGAKRAGKQGGDSRTRFAALIPDEAETEAEAMASDAASSVDVAESVSGQGRPASVAQSAGGMDASETSAAELQLRSLLRDEFIIGSVVMAGDEEGKLAICN